MQLDNRTPFSAQVSVLPNKDAIDTLYTVVRATFNIGSKWTLCEEQAPAQTDDEYWGDPESSSLKLASDFHIGKASSDIIIMGSAHSFEQKPVEYLDVGVAVGSAKKSARVFGSRKWSEGFIKPVSSFVEMPLIYEKAFGGQDVCEGSVRSSEPRNPVGMGFKGKRSKSEMNGFELPHIEDPRALITSVFDTPEPVGFGCRAPHWMPRAKLGGTYDQVWEKKRAPYLPVDYSLSFNNSASPGLIYPGFLKGSEPVKIINMHPEGPLSFYLPEIKLNSRVRIIRKPDEVMTFNMETLIIEPDKLKLQMVWRAAHVVNNNASKVNKIELSLSR